MKLNKDMDSKSENSKQEKDNKVFIIDLSIFKDNINIEKFILELNKHVKKSAIEFSKYILTKKIVSSRTGEYTPPEFQLMYGTLIKQGDELWKEFQDGRALVNNTINEK